MTTWVIAVAALAADNYLTEVVGAPVATQGTAAEIAARAEACLVRTLRSGEGGRVILSRNAASGVVVAANALTYHDGPAPYMLRSRVTVQAQNGRFRIRHDSIERRHDQSFGAIILRNTPWRPVGKWWGSGWALAEAALTGVSQRITACTVVAR